VKKKGSKLLWCLAVLAFILVFLMVVRQRVRGDQNAPAIPPFTDYRGEAPGNTHKITVADLPAPYASQAAINFPSVVDQPKGAWPKVPAGFKVERFAEDLENPRLIRTAPNGDLFLAESAAGRVKVFRGISNNGRPSKEETFASDLNKPFGIAFYHRGDMKARGPAEKVVPDLPGGGLLPGGGHWTRDIAFSPDGHKMFVSVGSHSNVDDADTHKEEFHRADILEFNPDGSGLRVFAYGIRNPVGIAVNPQTGELWCSTNERDNLGDNLVPDYITHVQDGGFYGWPWWYMGPHQDPRHEGKHPELKDKVITPDVILQPHNASLEMTFYDGKRFPAEYSGDIFAAEHGSWNKAVRTGYEVIRVPLHGQGHATGEYQDFLTGFVTSDGNVWGRPVGVAVASDGSLLVSDDGSNSIWRVSYVGN
jgi:glucose/arabinose dehydrogenase